jgi:hypothetical protein
MTFERRNAPSAVERDTVRTASKLLLAAATLVFVLVLLTLLPGVDRLVPETPVSFAALVGAVVTVAVVALLLSLAPRLASLARMRLAGPRAVVENLASVVYWLVVLAAVLVAHRGLAGALTPLLDGATWTYDVVFLLLALPTVTVVAARLSVTLDPGADLVADTVVGSGASGAATHGDAADATTDSTGDDGDDATTDTGN